MRTEDEQLKFQSHIDNYSWAFSKNDSNNSYFTKQAQHMHALQVWNGSQELITTAALTSQEMKSSEAVYYIRHGLGRRSRAIWFSFRELYQLIPPDREEPLAFEDADRSSELLNAIYINIRGALDNLAWALVHAVGGPASLKLKESSIGLFNRQTLGVPKLGDLDVLVKPFVEWNKEFKRFRDPAAHRIPLRVISAIQDERSLEVYQRIQNQWSATVAESSKAATKREYHRAEQLFSEADGLHVELQKVGSFSPLFEYEVNTQPMAIYPTVAEDVGVYVQIARRVLPLLLRLDVGQ